MAAKLTRLAHKIAIQRHVVAELYHLQFSLQARKLLDTPTYCAGTTLPLPKFKMETPYETPRRWCKTNDKIDLRDVECESSVWVQLAQDRGHWCSYERDNGSSYSIKQGLS
jgi:hypothetical protein